LLNWSEQCLGHGRSALRAASIFLTVPLIPHPAEVLDSSLDRDCLWTNRLRYLFEDYALDTDRRELRRGATLVPLAPQVFDLLHYLIRNRERVVAKDDLLCGVWGGRIVSDSALVTRINGARTAIGDSGEQQRFIKTLPRKGFRFVGVVREQRAPLVLLARPSVAVCSFDNMSGGLEQEHFADGVAEEIIMALSRCTWLVVVAGNSSLSGQGPDVDVRRVGQQLGVRYMLGGSVRRAGHRLRITCRLVEASSGACIWADRFDGDVSEVFELQDRITESVAAAIEPKLQLAEIERVRHKREPDFDPNDLLLRAQALEYEFTEASLAGALRCLEEALAIDPHHPQAMALSAYCYAERHNQGWTDAMEADGAKGLALAMRATELGKADPNVLWMSAFAIRALGADAHRARGLLEQSLHLNPNSAIALTTAGWNEGMLGNPQKALQLLQRAARISPRDPRAWYMASAAALSHFAAGQFEEAVVYAKRCLAQNPRFTRTLRVLAASQANLGRTDDARNAINHLLKIEPRLTLEKIGWRLRHMDESVLMPFLEGLRRAGLPG
jgi:TolB-like protein/Tfp pilus assembly protein PilF